MKNAKKKNKRGCANSNLVHDNHFTFYKYHDIREFTKRPLHSKLNLKEFKDKLVLFYHDTIEIRPNNESQIKDLENTKVVLYIALKLRNNLLHMYKNQDDKFKKAKKKRRKVQNVSENLAINLYLDEDDLPPMSALEGAKEVKLEPGETIVDRLKLISQKGKASGTGLKFLTPKKLLTRLPKLLAQIKSGNNSYNLKNENRKIIYLFYQHNKLPKKLTTI